MMFWVIFMQEQKILKGSQTIYTHNLYNSIVNVYSFSIHFLDIFPVVFFILFPYISPYILSVFLYTNKH